MRNYFRFCFLTFFLLSMEFAMCSQSSQTEIELGQYETILVGTITSIDKMRQGKYKIKTIYGKAIINEFKVVDNGVEVSELKINISDEIKVNFQGEEGHDGESPLNLLVVKNQVDVETIRPGDTLLYIPDRNVFLKYTKQKIIELKSGLQKRR